MPRSLLAVLVCVLTSLGCGATASGGEGAGETTAASGSEGSGDATDTGEEEPPMDCGSVSVVVSYSKPIVMFVVDTSPSMLREWDHDGDPGTPPQTRWASARALLEDIAAGLFPYAVVGLQRFPGPDACPGATSMSPTCADASACTIAAAPELGLLEAGAAQLVATLPPADVDPVAFAGASPAAVAYASAVEQVVNDPHRSFRAIILLTDGHHNCGSANEPPDFAAYDDSLRSLIEDAYVDHGVATYVIAVDEAADPQLDAGLDVIPGFDPRPALHELGLAGGVGARFPDHAYLSAADPNTPTVFESEQGSADCVVDLTQGPDGPPTPEQVPLVTWTINGEPIPYVDPAQCDSQTGWTWIVGEDVGPGELVLFCGAACDALDVDGTVAEGHYGCPPPT